MTASGTSRTISSGPSMSVHRAGPERQRTLVASHTNGNFLGRIWFAKSVRRGVYLRRSGATNQEPLLYRAALRDRFGSQSSSRYAPPSRCSLDAVGRFAQARDLRCRAIYRPAFQATETPRAAVRARADPSGTAARCSVSNAALKPARAKTAFASTAAVAGPPTRRCKISMMLA